MTGSIKDYTPNFEFIIPEFNITGWHDYLEENFRSIDALFYNLFGINNFKGQWKNSTVYNVDDVVFIGEDTDYSGRLVKVLVQHTTAGTGNFTEFFTANPSYYELFADASTAQLYAQEAKDWAVKLDGPVEDDLYSSKFYANIVNDLSTEITTLYNIRSDIQNVSLIGTEVVNVSNIKNSVQTVASMQSDINDVAAIKSDIEWVADNDTIVTNVSNNSTKITTVANNISSVSTTATNITDINTVAGISSNITSVAGNLTNINSVAGNITNINNVANNETNINTVAGNSANISTNAINISAINTNASNISDIQNAYSNAQSALNSKNLAQEWAISENIVDSTDYSAKHYAEIAAQYANPLRIGQIIQSTIPLSDAGLHLLDGSLIQGNGSYADFVTYIAGLVSTYPSLFETEANWQTSVMSFGSCEKYVYDSVNNTVRLPKYTTEHGYLIKSYANGADWYRIYSDGWCEQGGTTDYSTNPLTINLFVEMQDTNYTALAIEQNSGGGCWTQITGKTTTTVSVGRFYASGSSGSAGSDKSVNWKVCGYTNVANYKNTIYEYIVLATSTKTDIQVDIDEIVTDLNEKVDKNDLATVHCVVETYQNGLSWYRVYDDGWCEQGGFMESAAGRVTVNLLKSYRDTAYSVQITSSADNNTSGHTQHVIHRHGGNNTSYFQTSLCEYYGTNTFVGYWETKGYIS